MTSPDPHRDGNYVPDRTYQPHSGADLGQPSDAKDTTADLKDATNPGGDGAQRAATWGFNGCPGSTTW